MSSVKEGDLQGVLDEVKKHGGDDIKRIVDKVEKKIKDAKGNVTSVDWKSLAQELKEELPKDKQQYVDLIVGKIPDKEDFEKLISKAKETGQEQFKAAEKAASKILQQVEKAKKEGKGQANAFLSGLKQCESCRRSQIRTNLTIAAPEDLDDLVNQLKEGAKKAGLPADTIESWLKSKAKDNKIDAEALVRVHSYQRSRGHLFRYLSTGRLLTLGSTSRGQAQDCRQIPAQRPTRPCQTGRANLTVCRQASATGFGGGRGYQEQEVERGFAWKKG